MVKRLFRPTPSKVTHGQIHGLKYEENSLWFLVGAIWYLAPVKPKLSSYRKRIAKIRGYLSLLVGGANKDAHVLKYAFLIDQEITQMPYSHPKRK